MLGCGLQTDLPQSSAASTVERLLALANSHACSSHALFDLLENANLSDMQVAALLRNYDAHASVLRRLLLNAASIMPEEAVPFVLENVRNEYGNGDYAGNHQDQLRDLAWSCGISKEQFFAVEIKKGIRDFIKSASQFYSPKGRLPSGMKRAAIVAGAITATELLAIKEFAQMQKAFASRKQQHHIWFHHVSIEQEHFDESMALALFFADKNDQSNAVEFGLNGVLSANVRLYDGLLESLQ
ncbi:MAG: iron-containing redox enzyme family protein [Candidatus Obscuribacterales bacterium]|nr:iron-containing redox enzyme family protein [Candidatus Obscuribacterales bacterium]